MERHLLTTRTARYQQLGEPTTATRQLWLVLHGYGQLAEYFVRHFASLHASDPAGTVIVAPEALSRFYLQHHGGRVGASWMTSADRLTEIADQRAYLDDLLGSVLFDCPPGVRVTVVGFSQGTATASRWLAAAAGRWRPHQLVLWAGDFPADALPAPTLLAGLPIALVRGDRDEFVSHEAFQHQAELLQAAGALVTTHTFEGGHTIHQPLLHQLHQQ